MSGSPDVIVIGAGVVGAMCAMRLAESGLSVTVVEEGFSGGGSTGAAMGHIVVMDDSAAQRDLAAHSRTRWGEILSTLPVDPSYQQCGTLWLAANEEELAIAGAAALTDHKMTPVKFIDAKMVADGFAQGAVLEDGSNGENYMVHASRREKAGMSEVHELDTDIIYVLDGTATFVTGGTSVDPKMVAANEFRGSMIDGGETRQLKKGDVVIVPKGTPHWFKQVGGAFLYYVVKVR